MADLVNGLGGAAGFGEFELSLTDDGSSVAIDISSIFGAQGINFYGTYYTTIYVNNNGNVTLGQPYSSFSGLSLSVVSVPIITPYFYDADTRGSGTLATPGGTSTGSNRVYYDLDTVNNVFTATWDDVGYYSRGTDRPNAFQLRLFDRGDGDFDIEFRYEAINYAPAGGSIGGFASGNGGYYFALPGSGTTAMLNLEQSEGNSGTDGVWGFEVRDGLPPNEAPTDIVFTSAGVDENAAGAVVGTFSAVDPDAGDTHSFTLVEGGDLFEIVGNQLRLKTGVSLDFEATHPTVKVRAADYAGATFDKVFQVTVLDVNEAPVITSGGGGATASVSVAENGTVVTTVVASDVESPAPTYAIAGGADAALFDIDAASGVLTFKAAPDCEAPADADGDNVYEVTVQAVDDGGLFAEQALSVTVTNVNEAPLITSDGGGATASVSVAENGTSVTTVVASDIDSPAPTYAIGGGADAALFAIDAATGALTFVTAPDHEAPADADGDNVYEVVVQAADDGGLFAEQALAVTVTNVNEAPTGLSATGLSVLEGAASGTIVGTLVGEDPDSTGLTYTLLDDAGGRFVLDGDEIKVAQGWLLDYEQAASHMIRVGVSDGAFSLEKEFTVAVGDVSPEHFTTGPGGGTLEGGGEGDFVTGNIGPDHLSGGGGNDFVTGGGGGDTMDGGDGFDSVSWFSAPEGVVLDLADQANNGGAATGDTVADFEVYYLSEHGDTVTAGDDGVYLYGFGGDDTLTGGAGSDFIDGGAGADTIDGGDGFDYASWYTATSGVTVNLQDPSKNTGDAEGDTLANVEAFYLTAHDDVFVGQDGQNIVFGQEGDDDLTGGAVSNDWLFGGAGDDRLTGGVLDDLLSGGDGKDTYVFLDPASNGFDQVLDFVSGEDAIELSAEGFGLAKGTAFSAGASFIASENPLAVTGEATLLYATGLGILYYDPDGNGAHAAYALAQFAAAPTLEASDFYVV